MRRLFRAATMAISLWGLGTVPAASTAPLSDEELEEVRGGYITVGGLTFDFGAMLQTFVDGSLALQSTLSLTAAGAVRDVQLSGNPALLPLTAATGMGLDAGELHDKGVALPGVGGTTVLIQDLSEDAIRNIVVNTAQGRTIFQNTSINITIPNLPELQRAISAGQAISGIGHSLDSGLLGSVSH